MGSRQTQTGIDGDFPLEMAALEMTEPSSFDFSSAYSRTRVQAAMLTLFTALAPPYGAFVPANAGARDDIFVGHVCGRTSFRDIFVGFEFSRGR